MSPMNVPTLVLTDMSNVVIKPRQQEFEKSVSNKSENGSPPPNRPETSLQQPAAMNRGSHVSSLSIPPLASPDDQNLMSENTLFGIDRYKIRRKGDVENAQDAAAQVSISIDSPIGCAGDSTRSGTF
jgi:hypothetical protein